MRRDEEARKNRDATRDRLQSQIKLHQKSRDEAYPVGERAPPVYRFPVADEMVPWEIKYEGYRPKTYTDVHVLHSHKKMPKVADADLITK